MEQHTEPDWRMMTLLWRWMGWMWKWAHMRRLWTSSARVGTRWSSWWLRGRSMSTWKHEGLPSPLSCWIKSPPQMTRHQPTHRTRGRYRKWQRKASHSTCSNPVKGQYCFQHFFIFSIFTIYLTTQYNTFFILSSFTQTHVIPNLYDFLSCVEHKRHFEELYTAHTFFSIKKVNRNLGWWIQKWKKKSKHPKIFLNVVHVCILNHHAWHNLTLCLEWYKHKYIISISF